MKKKKSSISLDVIKGMRKGGRELEQEIFGPGFHAFNRTFKSKKTYTRKMKHKNVDGSL